MSEHPNAVLYRRLMEGFGEGDTSAFAAAIADHVVWWQIGSPWAFSDDTEAIVDFFSRFG